MGRLEDEGAGRAAGLKQRHGHEHRHAHHKHDVGHLEGGELTGGAVADAVVHRVAEHGQQQEQQSQGGDHHRAAGGDQRHAAHRAQGAQHLLHRDALVEHQHVHKDAAHGHGGNDGAGHGGGRVEDAVILKDKVGHRLDQSQQHQTAHRLVIQVEGEELSAPELARQGVDGDDQRHGRHGHREAEGQQHRGLGHGQGQLGEHEAHAEDDGGDQRGQQTEDMDFFLFHGTPPVRNGDRSV